MFPNDIENEFKHCNECIKNVNLEPKIYNENDKNDLIFYDESIDVKKNIMYLKIHFYKIYYYP